MAISRAQLAKELEPGLNSLFGMSYDTYSREYEQIFAIEDSQRAFEEEVLQSHTRHPPIGAAQWQRRRPVRCRGRRSQRLLSPQR